MIDRKADVELVRTAIKRSRVVALPGPRQSGKTTLARHFVPGESLNQERYTLVKKVEVGPPAQLVNA